MLYLGVDFITYYSLGAHHQEPRRSLFRQSRPATPFECAENSTKGLCRSRLRICRCLSGHSHPGRSSKKMIAECAARTSNFIPLLRRCHIQLELIILLNIRIYRYKLFNKYELLSVDFKVINMMVENPIFADPTQRY